MIEHLKLRKRHRFKTTEELEAFFAAKDFGNGLEYSYAQKCTIMREQIQLRKKLDGVVKVGETQLHNFSDTKKYPTPLPGLWALFNLMCARESAHGIPPPVKPELMEKRLSKAGDDGLANKLLKEQHKAAAALTNAFYLNHRVEEEGEFVAYKMTRTLVERPRGYVGVAVQKKFDGTIYQGDIIDYCDHKQWWRVEFKDGDFEDWSVPDMKKWVPEFLCGAIIDGATENTAAAMRARLRERRVRGRSNPMAEVAKEMIPLIAAAQTGDVFELPQLYDQSAGTVWKLLKIYIGDDRVRLGVYIAADEASSVDADDLKNLSPDQLEESYDVEVSPLEDIESWIKSSATLKGLVDSNPNARRRSPRVLYNAPAIATARPKAPAIVDTTTLPNGFRNYAEPWEAAAVKAKGVRSAGRGKLLVKHEGATFFDVECDQSRVIVDLEWSQRKWVVVTQISAESEDGGVITDESLESYVINGELYNMIAHQSDLLGQK